ncbi:GntR family transcriptional regulator [Actinomycetota bacterium]|nr:GntR family transcriptional regulator [Actinomycetota bacterium]
MQQALDNDRPIFLQVKEAIEGDILSGLLKPDDQIPSNSQLVSFFGINPVTVHKGITLLAEEGTVYKKRGLGMFVSANAPMALRKKYGRAFAGEYIDPLVQQARLLGMNQQEVQALLDQAFNNRQVRSKND